MFDFEFFPTPNNLIDIMLRKVNFDHVYNVLEPSAGDGKIASQVLDIKRYGREPLNVDVIEIDPKLQMILKSNNHRLIHDDFLSFNTYKKYDLIIMNPPFSVGEKHINKALDIIEYSGGQVVCLLMESSIKNPSTNVRKALLNRLTDLNADISYFESPFVDAEVKTSVNVAMIYVNVPNTKNSSIIFEHLKADETFSDASYREFNELISGNYIEGLIEQCRFEIACGVKLINDLRYLNNNIFEAPLIDNSSSSSRYKNFSNRLDLTINGQSTNVNSFVKATRLKYWKSLFDSEQFNKLLTNDLRMKYSQTLNDLADYDFSMFNINQITHDIKNLMSGNIEDTIIKLFDEFSRKFSYDDFSKNIHLYNGWKSNKAWKINKRIIIPLDAIGYNGAFKVNYYTVVERLADIEKVMNYLDVTECENIDLRTALDEAQECQQYKKIKLKHFTVTFYKKKTCHIEFTNMKALDKLNIFGSQKKGWLPPSYATKNYRDLHDEEKVVVDSFEGAEHYNMVCANSKEYLFQSNRILRLTA